MKNIYRKERSARGRSASGGKEDAEDAKKENTNKPYKNNLNSSIKLLCVLSDSFACFALKV
jgi:hypothetical protein